MNGLDGKRRGISEDDVDMEMCKVRIHVSVLRMMGACRLSINIYKLVLSDAYARSNVVLQTTLTTCIIDVELLS